MQSVSLGAPAKIPVHTYICVCVYIYVVLVSGVQQSDPVIQIHIYILFHIYFQCKNFKDSPPQEILKTCQILLRTSPAFRSRAEQGLPWWRSG